ncbi:MAG: MFS transporter, partial [Burkholderiales bacterium]
MSEPILAESDAPETERGTTSAMPWALTGLSLAVLMPSLDTSIANASLPAMAQAFNASFQEVQWIVLAYLLAITTLIVGAGRLGDMFGRRRLLLAGIVLFTAASLLCGVATTLWMLVTARVAQGLGAAIMMALAIAFVGDTVPNAKTGSAMGILGTMSAVGTTLGPSLGGLLIARVGWGAIFLINVPFGILTFLLGHRYLPADRQNQNQKPTTFDAVGTMLLALALAAYALAMTIGHGQFSQLNIALILAAVCGAGLFILVEARIASPLIQLATFHDPVLSSGLMTSALVSTVMMAT